MLIVKNEIKKYAIGKKNKSYEIIANNLVSCEIKNGSIVWIYGNSGSGKTTFLNVISGIDYADSGIVDWDGINICKINNCDSAKFRLNNCGLVFQFFELIKNQTAFFNASVPLMLQKKSKRDINSTLQPLFEKYDLNSLCQKKIELLSGGERQRIAIVRALSTNPKYLICDEITASLDSELSNKTYDDIRHRIKKNNGMGVFVSHDPIIKEYADEIYQMESGKLTCVEA